MARSRWRKGMKLASSGFCMIRLTEARLARPRAVYCVVVITVNRLSAYGFVVVARSRETPFFATFLVSAHVHSSFSSFFIASNAAMPITRHHAALRPHFDAPHEERALPAPSLLLADLLDRYSSLTLICER